MERVSESDRGAAIKAVDAALADGRIVQADRDQRVNQLRNVQTRSELQMITHDLQHREPTWTTYTPPDARPDARPEPPPATVGYGPPQAQAQTSSPEVARLFGTRARSRSGFVLIPFVLVLLFAGGTMLSVFNSFGDSDDSIQFEFDFDDPDLTIPDFTGSPQPRLLTVRGFQAMRTAIRTETGSTEVFRAAVYPEHATLDVPAQATGKRAYRYFYDGELDEPRPGQSTDERFDLAEIDPAVMIKLVRKARSTLVDDATSWYVIISRPAPDADDAAWFTAYASNDFQETGYVKAALDGTVVRRYVSE